MPETPLHREEAEKILEEAKQKGADSLMVGTLHALLAILDEVHAIRVPPPKEPGTWKQAPTGGGSPGTPRPWVSPSPPPVPTGPRRGAGARGEGTDGGSGSQSRQ